MHGLPFAFAVSCAQTGEVFTAANEEKFGLNKAEKEENFLGLDDKYDKNPMRVPTTFNEMILFNASVMGCSQWNFIWVPERDFLAQSDLHFRHG